MSSFDIVGYTFKAENYCSDHLIEALPTAPGQEWEGMALAAGVTMSTEDNLTELAAMFGILRTDETSFDSDEFPKVIFEDQIEDLDCQACYRIA